MKKMILSLALLISTQSSALAAPQTGGPLFVGKTIHYILILTKKCGDRITTARYRFRTASRALNAKRALTSDGRYSFVAMYVER